MFSGLILLVYALIGQTFQYDMDPVTRNPSVPMPTPVNVSRMELLEFELQRSPTLQTVEGRLGLSDVQDLCYQVDRDPDMRIGFAGRRIFHFVPVTTLQGYGPPIFVRPCFGWVRKRCSGTPRPPFDYRCHFWVPYYILSDPNCYFAAKQTDNGVVDNTKRRRKRMANLFEPTIVNGLEAATLCATSAQLSASDIFKVDSLALPTNEATELRCISWKITVEGDWEKQKLGKQACSLMNNKRPQSHIANEVSGGLIENVYADVISCEAVGKIVKCKFLKPSVKEPNLLPPL